MEKGLRRSVVAHVELVENYSLCNSIQAVTDFNLLHGQIDLTPTATFTTIKQLNLTKNFSLHVLLHHRELRLRI